MVGMLLLKARWDESLVSPQRFRCADCAAAMTEQILEQSQWVPRPLEEVFAFFSDEKNLETLTPAFLKFRVLGKSTPKIQEGTLIHYRLSLHGLPMRWTSRIEEWTPNQRFVDTQVKGPYSLWHHTHSFEPENGGTRMKDRVRFRLPGGWLGQLAAGWVVRRDVERIFAFRKQTIERLFAP